VYCALLIYIAYNSSELNAIICHDSCNRRLLEIIKLTANYMWRNDFFQTHIGSAALGPVWIVLERKVGSVIGSHLWAVEGSICEGIPQSIYGSIFGNGWRASLKTYSYACTKCTLWHNWVLKWKQAQIDTRKCTWLKGIHWTISKEVLRSISQAYWIA
jgi:hypothetical protein